MSTNLHRYEALEIWNLIADGILDHPDDPPTPEYCQAIQFVREVASGLIQADSARSGNRSDAITRAVKLTAKMTKFEGEKHKAMQVIDDFYPDGEVQEGKRQSKNKAVVSLLRHTAEHSGDQAFKDHLDVLENSEISSAIRRLRRK